MHFKPLSNSRNSKLMVCGLDHSGSQPLNYDYDGETDAPQLHKYIRVIVQISYSNYIMTYFSSDFRQTMPLRVAVDYYYMCTGTR